MRPSRSQIWHKRNSYSSDWGTVRPMALAVLRLMTSSNFVGCSIGRSAGRAPFRILSARRAVKARWAAVRAKEEGRLALRVPLRVVLTSRGGNPQSD